MTAVAIPLLWALLMFSTRFVDPLPLITAVAISMAAIAGWRERRTLGPLFLVTPRIAFLAIGATAAMVAVTYVLFPLLVAGFPPLGTETPMLYARFFSHRTVWVLIACVVPVVVAEEVLWRGVFQSSLIRMVVPLAAVTYAVAHLPSGSLLLAAAALICGFYWSALRKLSGSLVPSLCAHLVWDIALIVIPLSR